MKADLAIICPLCGARVRCTIKSDTGGVEIKTDTDESVVVLVIDTSNMKRHTKENHG